MPNRSGIELTRDDLPMWRWARLATPEFFNRIPKIPLENLPPEFGLAVVATEESKAAEEEPKKEKQTFHHATVTTQYCIEMPLREWGIQGFLNEKLAPQISTLQSFTNLI